MEKSETSVRVSAYNVALARNTVIIVDTELVRFLSQPLLLLSG